MKKFTPYLFIFVAVLSAACGNNNNTKPTAPFPNSGAVPETILRATPEEASLLLEAQTIVCTHGSKCPEAVGLVTWGLGNMVYRCSGSLVAPNIVMTNSHCIPSELKSGPMKWKGHLRFILPSLGDKPGEKLEYDSILSAIPNEAVKDHMIDTDIAFIKLKTNSARTPLKIDASGISDNEVLKLQRVNPVSDTTSKIDFDECRAVQSSLINLEFSQNVSRTVTISGCEIVHGNSGSPLLGASGQVKGIISAGLFPEELPPESRKNFEDLMPPKNVDNDLRHMGTGTNLSCVVTPSSNTSTLPSQCAFSPTAVTDKLTKLSNELVSQKFLELTKALIPKWLKENAKGAQWTFSIASPSYQEGHRKVIMETTGKPHCFLSDQPTSESRVEQGQSPVWKLFMSMDSQFRFVFQIEKRVGETYKVDLKMCDQSNSETRIASP